MMLGKNVTAKIYDRLNDIPAGQPFATRFLSDLGARDSVDKALSRMVMSGELLRVARGMYARPKHGVYMKVVMPQPEAIARAAAESSGSEIGIHGAVALQLLGLSTQMPMQPVFLTNGPSRKIKYGNIEIRMKHVSQNKLPSGLSGKSALAYSALCYLGRNETTYEILASIRDKLSGEEYDELLRARNNMPAWLSDMLLRASIS
jgi:hypothetical protein